MITITMLAVIIADFCQLDNKFIDYETRVECIEFMSNCAIIDDGKTNKDTVEECQEKWNLKRKK